jgi:hypothetical protein
MIAILTALLAAELGGLTLEVTSPQRALLVGEPLKLTLSWKASPSVSGVAVEDPDFLFGSVLLSVDHGAGARLYREHPHQLLEKALVRRTVGPAEEVVNVVFSSGGYLDRPGGVVRDGLLFARPGVYSVTALYVHDGARPSGVASNTLRFRVLEPRAADREVLRELESVPGGAGPASAALRQARARELLERYPDSPYLRLARLERYREQDDALHNERDPLSGESIHHLGREGMAALRRQHYRRLAEEILAWNDWGPFEEEALALASLYALGAGEMPLRDRARQMLLDRHPGSASARQIQAEDEAPR